MKMCLARSALPVTTTATIAKTVKIAHSAIGLIISGRIIINPMDRLDVNQFQVITIPDRTILLPKNVILIVWNVSLTLPIAPNANPISI